jgi:phosphoribosylanthranilate isomerase
MLLRKPDRETTQLRTTNFSMTWVKICGNTNLEDARAAVDAGADALGFVFAESPRRISPELAAQIVAQLPGEVEKVGVFVNELPSKIRETVKQVGLTAVQLHGDETVAYAEVLFSQEREWHPKVYRALAMSTVFSVTSGATFLHDRRAETAFDAVLVDSGSPARHGGTGLTFDWSRAQPLLVGLRKKFRVVVAGGLTPENVAKAIEMFKPWGVDVASGVEARPGKKDHEKIRSFIAAVRKSE